MKYNKAQELLELIQKFVEADTWQESKQIVTANPQLLSEEIEHLFDFLIKANEAEHNKYIFTEYRQLLYRCRTEGIEAAFTKRPPKVKLAGILRELNKPDNFRSMPRRITLCQQALTYVSKTDDPKLWAELQTELGNSYAENLSHNKADNLEQSIICFKKALQVITRNTIPIMWASIMNNLANAYSSRSRGERSDNLEQAIAYFENALQVRTRSAIPIDWAQTMNNLGVAYIDRICGERSDNLEQAIACFENALQVRTRKAMLVDWAQTLNNFANAYFHRIQGKRTDNLEKAITCFENALQVRTYKTMPIDWAQTMNNLAAAYSERIQGMRANNLEKALVCYQKVLQVRTYSTMPVDWAQTMNNLASVYLYRIRGTRADNLEKSITYFENALRVRTREDMPVEWTLTKNNLANAYSDRLQGARSDNLEKAINHYKEALEVITYKTMPVDWAIIMSNLANAYNDRIRGKRSDNLEQAIACFEDTLKIKTRSAMPVEWATTMNDIANVYLYRIRGKRVDNLEQAIIYYQRALQVRTRSTMPVEWAQTMNNLASAYSERIQGVRTNNLKKSISYYQRALQVMTLETMPYEYRHLQRLLGHLYFSENNWQAAHTTYVAALQTTETLYTLDEGTPVGRQAELTSNQDLAARVGYCLAKLGRIEEAIEKVEQGRTRAFSENYNTTLLKMASETDQQAYGNATEQVKTLEKEMYTAGQENTRSRDEVLADLKAARTQLFVIVETLRQNVPNFMPEGLNFQSICQLATTLKQPLVYLLTTPTGSLALIVSFETTTFDEKQIIWLDDFTKESLNGLLYDTEEKQRYLHGTVLADFPLLNSVLTETVLPQLNQQLINSLVTRLKELGYSQAVLIPMDTLNLLPLHACTDFTFSFAPSARLLQAALNQTQPYTNVPLSLLGIGNPTAYGQIPLKYGPMEVANIAALFPNQQQLCENAATREAVLTTIYDKTHIHFSCHGVFNQNEPPDSALYLAGNDRLTVQDLILGTVDLARTQMVVLAACQTGITDFTKIPNEVIGFSGAFMQAGVPAIINTLWAVEEIATMLLLQRFYQLYLQENQPPVQALQQAQYWLRDATVEELGLVTLFQKIYLESEETDEEAFLSMQNYKTRLSEKPFAHPYYWAGFVFYGV